MLGDIVVPAEITTLVCIGLPLIGANSTADGSSVTFSWAN